MNEEKIVMPRRLRKKWLDALRSGEYKQCEGQLYGPESKSFCCLGVLEHVAMGGMVENIPNVDDLSADEIYALENNGIDLDNYTSGGWGTIPSGAFLEKYKIEFPKHLMNAVIAMNDGDGCYLHGTEYVDTPDGEGFNDIADFIQAHSVGR